MGGIDSYQRAKAVSLASHLPFHLHDSPGLEVKLDSGGVALYCGRHGGNDVLDGQDTPYDSSNEQFGRV